MFGVLWHFMSRLVAARVFCSASGSVVGLVYNTVVITTEISSFSNKVAVRWPLCKNVPL